MQNKFWGTGVALVTPFKNDGSVDHDALAKIVEYNIQNGVEYLVISGTTGESVTITKQEKKEIIKTVERTNNGRLPMILGIGGNNTAAIIEEIKTTDLSIFGAILSVSPYYTKPTQEGIYQHFKAVASACPIPVIIYNVPGRTSSNILPETTVRIANDCKNVIAIKEACNNVGQYLKLMNIKPKDFMVISGDDDLALALVLAGGSGVISVIGQAFPKEFSEMIRLGLQGKAKESYALHFKLMDATSAIFSENNPAGIKGLLNVLGLCNDTVRLPLVPATEGLKKQFEKIVRELKS